MVAVLTSAQGARLPELFCVLVALLLTFAVPRPAAIRPDGWGVLGVFVATIVGEMALHISISIQFKQMPAYMGVSWWR